MDGRGVRDIALKNRYYRTSSNIGGEHGPAAIADAKPRQHGRTLILRVGREMIEVLLRRCTTPRGERLSRPLSESHSFESWSPRVNTGSISSKNSASPE